MKVMVMTASGSDSTVQLITVILIFILVLALTYITTKFTAGLQKGKMASPNVEVMETFKLSTNKYIQIVRVGKKYYSIIVCKDTVTLMGELSEDEINQPKSGTETTMSFQEILNKAKNFKGKK